MFVGVAYRESEWGLGVGEVVYVFPDHPPKGHSASCTMGTQLVSGIQRLERDTSPKFF